MKPGSVEHNQGKPARVHVELPAVEEARKALASHEAQCPGSHFDCFGKPELERSRLKWIEQKHHLKAMLDMAVEASKAGWRDKDGNPTRLEWTPTHTPKPKAKAKADRAEAENKGGRPRSEKPSAIAQKWREIRERRKGVVAA